MNRTWKPTNALKDYPENNKQDVNDNPSFKQYPQRIMNRTLKTTNALKDFPENNEQDVDDYIQTIWQQKMPILWFSYTDPARKQDPKMLECWPLKHPNFHTTYVSGVVASKLAYIEEGDTEGPSEWYSPSLC